MRHLLLLPILLAGGCASYAASKQRAPESNVAEDTSIKSYQEIHVDLSVTGHTLAAYQLVIHYDPRYVRIRSIKSSKGSPYRGAPQFDRAAFGSGATRVFAADPVGCPAAFIHLLTVAFDPVTPGTSKVTVEAEHFYDDVPKPIQATLEKYTWELTFPK